MTVSVFDMFKVGIGPSSSHTVGPMVAATIFVDELVRDGLFESVAKLHVQLRGSLGATGKGHGTDRAVLAGLGGGWPADVDTDWLWRILDEVNQTKTLRLASRDGRHLKQIPFDLTNDLTLQLIVVKGQDPHPNTLVLSAFNAAGGLLIERNYYSIGGGFVATDDDINTARDQIVDSPLPYPFRTGSQLLNQCQASDLTIPELVLADEAALGRDAQTVEAKMIELWQVMAAAIDAGCNSDGVLPGGLGVRRRAAGLARRLTELGDGPMSLLDWTAAWAIAVNEENAAGGRMVTAPTNGAAGIIPAVLKFALATTAEQPQRKTITDFLLAAGAIGTIYQQTASISGAEVGCQGEVGVAASMAAAGLAQILGGTAQQVCNAAEIGLEHHLGLTCDPVGGLVQVPCIERNAMGAISAVTAARLALAGDGQQLVSLDQAMATMMATGADMMTKYKETSTGGLAVSLAEC